MNCTCAWLRPPPCSLEGLKHPVLSPCSSSSHSSEQDLGELPSSTGGPAPVVGAQQGVRSIHQDDGVRKSPAMIQQQRFKATCTCQARRPRKPRVATPRTFGMPRCHHWRTLRTARLCTSGPKWNAFTDARVRHTGEMGACPLHKRACPPQTFPPRRSSNVLPEPAPLAAAGDATSTAVVVFAAMAAAATRVGGRHHRNRAHGPDFVPDHVAGAPKYPRRNHQLCAPLFKL